MDKISTAEIADIMLRQNRPLTVSDVMSLASHRYPELQVTRQCVTNTIRHFVRSPHAVCDTHNDIYPHRYHLRGLVGYQFKSRGRAPVFTDLIVSNTSKAASEQAEKERRFLVSAFNTLWNSVISSRKAI